MRQFTKLTVGLSVAGGMIGSLGRGGISLAENCNRP